MHTKLCLTLPPHVRASLEVGNICFLPGLTSSSAIGNILPRDFQFWRPHPAPEAVSKPHDRIRAVPESHDYHAESTMLLFSMIHDCTHTLRVFHRRALYSRHCLDVCLLSCRWWRRGCGCSSPLLQARRASPIPDAIYTGIHLDVHHVGSRLDALWRTINQRVLHPVKFSVRVFLYRSFWKPLHLPTLFQSPEWIAGSLLCSVDQMGSCFPPFKIRRQ